MAFNLAKSAAQSSAVRVAAEVLRSPRMGFFLQRPLGRASSFAVLRGDNRVVAADEYYFEQFDGISPGGFQDPNDQQQQQMDQQGQGQQGLGVAGQGQQGQGQQGQGQQGQGQQG